MANVPEPVGAIRPRVRRLFRLALRSARMARADADAELDSFFDERVASLVARGFSPEDARTEALRRLGASSIDDAREQLRSSAQHREAHASLSERQFNLAFDFRYALRGVLATPAFTFAVVLTLALGIGSATAVFSIVNGVLLQALPYPEAHQLVRVYETAPAAQGGELRSIAIPTLDDWRRELTAFSSIALYGSSTYDLSSEQYPERLQGAAISASLFSLLGITPALGRAFTPDEERPGGPPVVVISHGLWQRRFAGDSAIVGRAIRMDRKTVTVIGVMPAGFSFPIDAELWAPIGTDHEYNAREARHMNAIARLNKDVSVPAATKQLLSVESLLANVYPKIYKDRGIKVIPLYDRMTGGVRPVLKMLAGAVLLVLLVACANVANLLLARGTARRRELAIRTALGGARTRIVEQLFMETAVLFVAAGFIGVVCAAMAVKSVQALPPDVLPRAGEIGVEWPVLLFAVLATFVTAIVFGLLPAIRATRVAPNEVLADGGRGSTGTRNGERLRSTLIVMETALAAVLLVGAGLLVRSLEQLRQVEPGFPVEQVLAFDVSLPPDKTEDNVYAVSFFRDLRERLANIPGVKGAGMASRLPLSGEDHSNSFRLSTDPATASTERSAQDRAISPGFFAALGVRLVRGREFTDADAAGTAPVIMVNIAFAEKYFGKRNAIGQSIVPTRAGGMSREIVGVVADTRQGGLDTQAEPEFYIPHSQDPWPFLKMTVRTDGNPMLLLPQVRAAVASMDRDLPLGDVRTIAQTVSASGAQRRIVALTLGVFAAVAYVLAAIGLYGIVAYAVTARTTEIGVRLALGAPAIGILRMVVGRGFLLASVGAALGLLAAIPLSQVLRGLLFGIVGNDPATFVAVGLLLPFVAVIASLIPARRALRIAPLSAMRG